MKILQEKKACFIYDFTNFKIMCDKAEAEHFCVLVCVVDFLFDGLYDDVFGSSCESL